MADRERFVHRFRVGLRADQAHVTLPGAVTQRGQHEDRLRLHQQDRLVGRVEEMRSQLVGEQPATSHASHAAVRDAAVAGKAHLVTSADSDYTRLGDRWTMSVGQGGPVGTPGAAQPRSRSEEHTSELQSRRDLVCRLLLEKKKKKKKKKQTKKKNTYKQNKSIIYN